MVIDVHTHILPGIDDGSPNPEKSLEMLRKEAEAGVDLVIFTPHYYVNRTDLQHFLAGRSGAFEKMKKAYQALEEPFSIPTMRWGAEVAYFRGISQMEGLEKLCINATDMLLLEMPYGPWDEGMLREIRDIRETRGLRIMLAHLERFLRFRENRQMIDRLLDSPCYVQVNADSLLEFGSRQKVLGWMKQDAVQFLASDCHGIEHRPPNLREGREILMKKMGQEWLTAFDAAATQLLNIKE